MLGERRELRAGRRRREHERVSVPPLERLVHMTTEHGTYGRIPLDDGQQLTGIAQAHAIEPGAADGQCG